MSADIKDLQLWREESVDKKGVCQICGSQGKTEAHHIISRAKISRLKPGEHGYDLDLMSNTGNLAELCVPCHELTDSHAFWRWMNRIEKGEVKGARKPNRRKYRSKKRGYRCQGIKKDGNQCGQKNKKIPKGGYCSLHLDQAPAGHMQSDEPHHTELPMPPLRNWGDWEDEPLLDAEHMAALVGLHRGFDEVDDYILELFEEWPDVWKKRWLYLEKW
ncbi:MAG: hypothetical protein VXY31_05125 [Candidatus Thermoplasmatota archaeon]|nr:hypothetical protein [Candidatus Thermoplasmatota archaeon]